MSTTTLWTSDCELRPPGTQITHHQGESHEIAFGVDETRHGGGGAFKLALEGERSRALR